MSTIASTAEAARRELGSSLNGELIGPDDASYNEGRAVFNAMIDRRPALIVRPTDAASVSAAVGFGRSHDLPIAVRGGGHNGGGLGVVDDGIVIDLSSMDSRGRSTPARAPCGSAAARLGQGRRGHQPARRASRGRGHGLSTTGHGGRPSETAAVVGPRATIGSRATGRRPYRSRSAAPTHLLATPPLSPFNDEPRSRRAASAGLQSCS